MLPEENDTFVAAEPIAEAATEVTTKEETIPLSEGLGFKDFLDRKNQTEGEEKKVEVKGEKKTEVTEEVPEVKEKKERYDYTEKELGDEPEETIKAKEKKQLPPRDFTGLNEEDKDMWNQMSRKAFDTLKPIFLEHKELKSKPAAEQTQKAEPYYNHPKGFVLAPEYEQKVADIQLADVVLKHWEKQDTRIRREGKFQPLLQDKEGNFKLGAEKEATAEDEVWVKEQVRFAQKQFSGAETQIENIQKNFKQKFDSDIGVLKKAESDFFQGFDDEKHPTQQLQKAIISSLPEAFRNDPLSGLLAKTGAHNALLMAKNKELMAELNKIKGVKKDTEQAPPTKKNFVSATRGLSSLSPADFLRRKQE